jgi:hypothetical protein
MIKKQGLLKLRDLRPLTVSNDIVFLPLSFYSIDVIFPSLCSLSLSYTIHHYIIHSFDLHYYIRLFVFYMALYCFPFCQITILCFFVGAISVPSYITSVTLIVSSSINVLCSTCAFPSFSFSLHSYSTDPYPVPSVIYNHLPLLTIFHTILCYSMPPHTFSMLLFSVILPFPHFATMYYFFVTSIPSSS